MKLSKIKIDHWRTGGMEFSKKHDLEICIKTSLLNHFIHSTRF